VDFTRPDSRRNTCSTASPSRYSIWRRTNLWTRAKAEIRRKSSGRTPEKSGANGTADDRSILLPRRSQSYPDRTGAALSPLCAGARGTGPTVRNPLSGSRSHARGGRGACRIGGYTPSARAVIAMRGESPRQPSSQLPGRRGHLSDYPTCRELKE
jgi:hypothetical protein